VSYSARLFIFLLPVLVGSMALHELAHAVVATRLGDPTARSLRRLTLNPLAHLDPLGTAMFVITYFGSGFLFGWAKPVPVQPAYFKHPQRGMAIVALAGPVTNLILAVALVALVVRDQSMNPTLHDVVVLAVRVNVVLGVFNLLPIPPLDGSRVAAVLLRDRAWRDWMALDRYGMVILLCAFVLFRAPFQTFVVGTSDAVLRVASHAVGG
jgi:Zn-dependent protease